MRKILLFLTTFFLIINYSFAENKVELFLSDSEVTLDQSFDLDIRITYDENFSGGEISIPGLEKFYQVSQSRSSNITSINGEVNQIQTINLTYYPNEVGNFEIGPAIIGTGSGTIKSDVLNLEVIDSKIDNSELDDSISGNEENKEENDIKGIKNSFFSLYSFLVLLFFIILSIVGLYFYDRNKNIEKEVIIEKKEDFKKSIIKELKKLEKDSGNLEKDIFYKKLNNIFRKYFDYIGIKDSFSMTLEQFKSKNINTNLFEIFEKTYYSSFDKTEDKSEDRVNIIKDFISKIK